MVPNLIDHFRKRYTWVEQVPYQRGPGEWARAHRIAVWEKDPFSFISAQWARVAPCDEDYLSVMSYQVHDRG